MRPVSDAFLRTVRGSHKMIARARVCTTFQSGTNPTGTDIGIVDGDVVQDGTAGIRSTLDLTTEGAWPVSTAGLLTPYGNEVFVERGIEYGTGTRESVSLGYFRISSVDQDRAPNGPIRLTGQDRMAGIIDAKLLAPVQFLPGVTFGQIFTQLVQEVYPSATIDYDDGTTTSGVALTRAHIAEEDRYGFLNDLAKSRGKVMYWDYRGRLQIKSPPNPTSPVFDVNHGAGGVLVNMSRSISREGVYNGVVAYGEGADTVAPSRAFVFDDNPDSTTYWFGPFGKVPRFYSSPFIQTVAQAKSAATSILTQAIGLPYNVDFAAVPNVALEPLDPVRVKYGDRFASETHILDRIRTPLTADKAMTSTTREQHNVVVGVA